MGELTAAAWGFVHTYGYLAIFLLLLVEESGIPLLFLPGELLVVWAGAQVASGNMEVLPVFLCVVVGVCLGSSVLYAISYRWGSPVLERVARFMRINPQRIEQAEGWVRARGPLAVAIGKLLPTMRTPTTLVSGTVRVPYLQFVSATAVGAVLWGSFYFTSGMLLGSAWEEFGPHIAANLAVELLLIIGLALGFIAAAAALVVLRRRTSPAAPSSM